MNSQSKRQRLHYFCSQNLKKYLLDSTLHGLHFVGDDSITLWERGFFLCAFIAALITTGNLIGYIYTKWNLTPIIIATNPYPTSISDIPFPAITLCNMNQLMLRKVANYTKQSYEGAMMRIACFEDIKLNGDVIPPYYKNNNISIPGFLIEYTQPCENMLLSCHFNSVKYNCSDLFRESLTDEGLCCVFNLVDPKYRYKAAFQTVKNYTDSDGAVPVDWNPERGYQNDLPSLFYPRTSNGIGVSMGLTLILNAELDDYFCSSTNGPGFKLDLHSPIEPPRVRDSGLTFAPGQDTRFRLGARTSSATPSTRGFSSSVRRCLFNDESNLVYYSYYTRKNCENECQAYFVFEACNCIPYNLPLVIPNATMCGVPDIFCVSKADNTWLRSNDRQCRRRCLNNCFDLTYSVNSCSAPLVQNDYLIQNTEKLANHSKKFIKENIAVLHIFFSDFSFYGDVRNVYVGFNEFLSNIGGIMGLFMGFSFISLMEIIYYAFIRPIFRWMRPEIQANTAVTTVKPIENTNAVWYSNELYPVKQKNLQNDWYAYQNHKNAKMNDKFKGATRWKNLRKISKFNKNVAE